LSVTTLGSRSPEVPVTYAGVPHVSGVFNTVQQRRLDGISGAIDTGQTPIRLTGAGFSGQLVGPIQFTDAAAYSYGTQYSFTIEGDGVIKTDTVQQIPGLVDVQLCTVTGCSAKKNDQLYLYAPGDPSVSSLHPNKGPAAGGTKVTIVGDNLGCPIYVLFGHSKAKSPTSAQVVAASEGLTCGSVTTLEAMSPPGRAHTKVPVVVMTVESYFANSVSGKSGLFTYT
jgi:hypothetical protein